MIIGFLFLISMSSALAQLPDTISYQGYLTDGKNPVSGNVTMQFSLYAPSSGETPIWSEEQIVEVVNGIYNVRLGEANTLLHSLPFDVPYYLGVRVEGDAEMTPRQPVTSVGYAFTSEKTLNLQCTGCISESELAFTPGDITTVNAGTGLTGGGLSNDVTLNVGAGTGINVTADAVEIASSYRIPQVCGNGQVAKVTAGTWTCGNDSDSGGTVTQVNSGTGLTGGPITTSGTLSVDFSGTGSAITASRSDHKHDDLYRKKYAKVAVVAQSGGDYTNPIGAINEILSWCGTPSKENPCLVKIMPGEYQLSAEYLVMQPYLDIEGSGENATRIKGNIGTIGVVVGASNAAIRYLTVENTGGGENAIGIYNYWASPSISHVTVRVVSGVSEAYGIWNGDYSSPSINDVSITSLGSKKSYGIYNYSAANATVHDTEIYVAVGGELSDNYGIYNYESNPIIKNIKIRAENGLNNYGIYNNNSDPIIENVDILATWAETGNYGIYNLSSFFTKDPPLASIIKNVNIEASRGTISCAIYNITSRPTLINVTALGRYATNSYGIYNEDSSAIIKSSSVVGSTSANSSHGYGVYSKHSSLLMQDVSVQAYGVQYSYGIYNDNPGDVTLMNTTVMAPSSASSGVMNTNDGGNVTVDHSRIKGASSVRNDNSSAIYQVGASKLEGVVSGTVKCFGCYDENYNAKSCP